MDAQHTPPPQGAQQPRTGRQEPSWAAADQACLPGSSNRPWSRWRVERASLSFAGLWGTPLGQKAEPRQAWPVCPPLHHQAACPTGCQISQARGLLARSWRQGMELGIKRGTGAAGEGGAAPTDAVPGSQVPHQAGGNRDREGQLQRRGLLGKEKRGLPGVGWGNSPGGQDSLRTGSQPRVHFPGSKAPFLVGRHDKRPTK